MMENVTPVESQERFIMNKKLRSPNQLGEANTMDSFQDGGQQNVNSEQNEYMNPMDGPHMNTDMNSYPPSSRESMMGVDSYNRMNQNMHPSQMQGYNAYNRETFESGDQHGGMQMTGSGDFGSQNSPFQGQYSQSGVRSGYPANVKPGMGGMAPPGGGMMPGYGPQPPQRNMMSGQNISQQGGPTPTLNQLLQTPNAPPSRMQQSNSYGDYPQKGAMEMGNPNIPYGMQHGWGGGQRPMGSYHQGPMPMPGTPYRNQSVGEMSQPRPGYSSPSFPMQGQYGGQQFSPNSRYGMMGPSSGRQSGQVNSPGFPSQSSGPYGHQQHYGQQNHMSSGQYNASSSYQSSSYTSSSHLPQTQHPPSQQQTPQMSGQPPGPTPPPPGARPSPSPSESSIHSIPQQSSPSSSQSSASHQQQQPATSTSQTSPSPKQQKQSTPPTSQSQQTSPAPNSSWNSSSKKSSEENEANSEHASGGDDVGSDTSRGTPTSSGVQHPAVAALRPIPSPVGSSGSRSNTPASLSGNQAGSPMPPRPPSQQLDGQNPRMTQSPMATQGYNQQMMPPPMGPNQMNYGPGSGKMPGSGMGGGPMPGHYPQYNSHFPQSGPYPGRQGPGMQGNSGMPNYPQQNMYNGPSQGQMSGNSHMYNNMSMNRNPSYGNMYGQGNVMNMNNQYSGNLNHMGPGPTPSGPGPGPGNAPSTSQNSSVNSMGQQGQNMSGGQGQVPVSSTGTGAPAVKGAQAAAQAALIAAATLANKSQPVRPTLTPNQMQNPQRMFGPQGPIGQMNHVGPPFGHHNSSMGHMPNSHSPVPNYNSNLGGHFPSTVASTMPNDSMNSCIPVSSISSGGAFQQNSVSGNTSASPHSSSHPHNSMASSSDSVPHPGSIHVDSTVNSSTASASLENSSMPSSNIPPSRTPNMQQHAQDSNSSSSSLSSASVPITEQEHSAADSTSHCTQNVKKDSEHEGGQGVPLVCSTTPSQSSNVDSSVTKSHQDSEMRQQGDLKTEQQMNSVPPDVSAHPMPPVNQRAMDQGGSPFSTKQEMPITTTATTTNADIKTIVTQSITSPVTSISETGNSNDSQQDHIPMAPHPNCLPMPPMPVMEEQPAPPPSSEKKKKEGALSHPPTPSSGVAPSPGGASISSVHEDFDNIASPASSTGNAPGVQGSWASLSKSGGDIAKLFEMGNEPDRRFFLDRLLMFLEERSQPLTGMPSISKQPLDLFRLYLIVRDKGGMMEVTKAKKWKEICGLVNIGTSASAAFTLKKNYIKYLFAYECQMDRGGIDPAPILAQMEAQLQQKREQKHRRAPSPAGSQGSQDAFRPPSTPNTNSQSMDGFGGQGMGHNFMPGQNSDHGMGPMGQGMMPPSSMMGNMMTPNTMGINSGMPHNLPNSMQGGMMSGNMPPGGMMSGGSYMPGHGPSAGGHGPLMGGNMMPHMGMPGSGGMPMNSGMHGNSGMPGSMGGNSGMPVNMPGSAGMPGNMSNNSAMPGNMSNNSAMPGNSGMPGNMPPGNSGIPGNMPGNSGIPGNMPGNSGMPGNMPGNSGMPGNMPGNSGMPGNIPGNSGMQSNMPGNSGMPGNMPSNSGIPGNMPGNSGMPGNMPGNSGMPGNMPGNSGMPGNMPGNSGMPGNMSSNSSSGMPGCNSMSGNSGIQQANSVNSGSIQGKGGMPGSLNTNSGMSNTSAIANIPSNNTMPPMSSSGSMMSSTSSLPSNKIAGDSVTCQDPFADEPRNGPYPRQNAAANSPMPNFSGIPPQPPSSMPNTYNSSSGSTGSSSNFNRPNVVPPNMPNFSGNISNQPNSYSDAGRSGPPSGPPSLEPQFSDTPPVLNRVPTSTTRSDGPPTSQFSNSIPSTSASSQGRQFPFGDQFSKPERFDSPTSSSVQSSSSSSPQLPVSSQAPVPPSSQHQSSQSHPPTQQPVPPQMDPMYASRYPGNQQPMPPHQGSQGHMDPYGSHPNYPSQGQPGYPGNKPSLSQDQYPGYPGQPGQFSGQRPMGREMSGPPGTMYGTPNKRYPHESYMGQAAGFSPSQSGYGERPSPYMHHQNRDSMMSPHDHGQMAPDGRRDMQFSPMSQRYTNYHSGMSPGGPFMQGGYPGRNQRMSPPRDKAGYMSPPKSQKPGMGQFPPKKEVIFPPDSVEAVNPVMTKRRRMTKADVGQVDAWRMMMALKSGLLAESTWALDTLNILLYDDSTVSYFSLSHLPGLLEVLLEHFRRCLIQMFGEPFEELERNLGNCRAKDELDLKASSLVNGASEMSVEKNKLPDYTYITRTGKLVKVEETEDMGPSDPKTWDVYSGHNFKLGHWQLGGGDTSDHIVPFFASVSENNVLKKLFVRPPMELKEEIKAEMDVEQEDEGHSEKNCECEKVEDENKEPIKHEVDMKGEEDVISAKNLLKSEVLNCPCDNKKVEKRNNVLKDIQIKSEPCEMDIIKENSSENPPAGLEEEVNEVKKEISEGNCEAAHSMNTDSNTQENKEGISGEENKENVKEETKEKSDVTIKMEKEDTLVDMLTKHFSLKRSRNDIELEDESYQRDEPPLFTVTDSNDELGRRCICISNIFRSLSCVPGNDIVISKHPGLMLTLGKLLQLHHRHLPRNTTRKKFDRDESELEDLMDNTQSEEEWWWASLTMLRENTLVIFANICGQLHLSRYPEEICMPILDGLLHWAVCPSSCATDPLPSVPSSVLSPQRLVLEALCKLCIHADNVDLLLATPPFERIIELFSNLSKLLANHSEPVTLEFAIVLLSELVQGDDSAVRAIAVQHPSISLLLDFLESAEQKAMQVVNIHGINLLRDNPEMMGTSLDMLRRAANILLHISYVPENRPLFSHHQQRILSLVMSQILDQVVAQILSDVLYQCFQSDS